MYDDDYLAIDNALEAMNGIDLRRFRAHPEFKRAVDESRAALRRAWVQLNEAERLAS